ncbi:hypothetical protein V8B97DRAFT_2103261 [Scleroderma yunnanense]
MSRLSREHLCRGGDGGCDCKCFQPKVENAAHCLECSHGLSKHPNTDNTQVIQMQPATIATVPGSSNVAKIFKGLTARWPSGLSQPNPRQEALATKATKATKASWMTSNATTNNHKTSSGQTFHVSSVAIMTCGLDANGKLLEEPVPQASRERRKFIQNLENHGCYLERQIQINTAWTHDDITSQLCTWFPHVFSHFDAQWVESNTPKIQLDWQLLVSDQGKLELSTASHLNGVVLTCFKGHPKASVADSNLWFVTRNPVPSHIFKSWRIGGDIVGTDIEALTDEDCNEGSEDGVIADLSSSIINLDIDVMTETSKRTCPITILSSPESINSRQVYRKKHKDLNAKAQPAWPHQSEGPIFGPLEVNKVAAENDEDAPVPPNLWVSLFEQTSMLRDKEISDVDL